MARPRKGSVKKASDGSWIVRFTFTDETGSRKDIRRKLPTRADAGAELRRLEQAVDSAGKRAIEADRMTFDVLADRYEKTYLVKAVYVDGRKVAGRRSLSNIPGQMAALRGYFGRQRLRSITHGDIERFRNERLKTPTRHDKPRAIASVNRELALLRAMLNMALREGWIARSPFNAGRPLISLADERQRERVLSREEEERLLTACSGRRKHLRPILVAALDTGCRWGELRALQWKDVDFAAKTVRIVAFNTKTLRERVVAMTSRLERELWDLNQRSPTDPEGLVFGISDNVKTAFSGIRDDTGLEDLRFHDLRHTAATRMVQMGVPLQEVGRALGHTQAQTTYRYVNTTVETARRAAAALDAFSVRSEALEAQEKVN